MQLPELHGNLKYNNFFIYAACDEKYFDDFALPIIKSIKQNTTHNLHLHIFNPRQDQIDLCKKEDISYSYEYIQETFDKIKRRWEGKLTDSEEEQYKRILGAIEKSKDSSILERLQKTYYACVRFIRLNQLVETQNFFAIDIDAIVRKNIPLLTEKDIYLHYVEKKPRFLAGGIYGSKNSKKFLIDYSEILKKNIEQDNLYWGLDQDVLKDLVPRFNWGQLPKEYIDWAMKPNSYIWTAKGARKELEIFKQEQQKYI